MRVRRVTQTILTFGVQAASAACTAVTQTFDVLRTAVMFTVGRIDTFRFEVRLMSISVSPVPRFITRASLARRVAAMTAELLEFTTSLDKGVLNVPLLDVQTVSTKYLHALALSNRQCSPCDSNC